MILYVSVNVNYWKCVIGFADNIFYFIRSHSWPHNGIIKKHL